MDTRRMMSATFYGGPCDGGVLTLSEPIRRHLRFPMSLEVALEVLEPARATDVKVPNGVQADYMLDMLTPELPYRDAAGRVRYLHVRPEAHPNPNRRNQR